MMDNKQPNQNDFNRPTLCIPLVSKHIKESHIRKIMDEINLGIIEKIDIVSVRTRNKQPSYQSNTKPMNRIFIHYKTWGSGPNATKARELLLKGKEIKVLHDELWFWKISLCKEKEKEQNTMLTMNPKSKATLTYLEKRKKIDNMNQITNRYMFFYDSEENDDVDDYDDYDYDKNENVEECEKYYVGMNNIPPKLKEKM